MISSPPPDPLGTHNPFHADEWFDRSVAAFSRAAGYFGLFLIVFVIAAAVRIIF